jgi:hypothetical protein
LVATVSDNFITTTYLIRVEIRADRKISKDTLVRYLVNGLEHSRSGKLGYEVTVYDDFELLTEPKDQPPTSDPAP